jgi:hypothetical protein
MMKGFGVKGGFDANNISSKLLLVQPLLRK